jgi:hypothetical protein
MLNRGGRGSLYDLVVPPARFQRATSRLEVGSVPLSAFVTNSHNSLNIRVSKVVNQPLHRHALSYVIRRHH